MNDGDDAQAALAAVIERRRFLLRATGVIAATAGLGACKHWGGSGGASGYPGDFIDRGGGGDNGGMGGGGDASGGAGGAGGGALAAGARVAAAIAAVAPAYSKTA